MIPIKSSIIEFDSIEGKVTKFGWSKETETWLMKSLTDMYSDLEMAPIREYSTNARDEHILHNIDNPIRVKRPTPNEPFFVISNDGPGMDEEKMKQVFTLYGESGKRHSNEFNGLMGFGSKSGLAYTNSFTVKSVCNGVVTHALINKGQDGIPEIRIISEQPSSDPSGTDITIPVHDTYRFNNKIDQFFRYWPEGSVKIDGKLNADLIGELHHKLADNVYVMRQWRGSYGYLFLMSGVVYSATYSDLTNNGVVAPKRLNGCLIEVESGSIEFSPNRESILFTPTTADRIQQILNKADSDVISYFSEKLSSSDESISDALWMIDEIGYKTVDIPFERDGIKSSTLSDAPIVTHRNVGYPNGSTSNTNGTVASLYTSHSILSAGGGSLVVSEFGIKESSARAQVRKYAKLKGIWDGRLSYSDLDVYFTPAKASEMPFIPAEKIVTWQEIKDELKGPKQAKGLYNIRHPREGQRPQELDPKIQYLAYSPYLLPHRSAVDTWVAIREITGEEYSLINIPYNRMDKLLRENDNVHSLKAVAKKAAEKDLESIDKIPYIFDKYVPYEMQKAVSRMSDDTLNKITDPSFKFAAKYGKLAKNKKVPKLAGYNAISVEAPSDLPEWNRYPLLDRIYYDEVNSEDVVIYINAKYDALKGGNNAV